MAEVPHEPPAELAATMDPDGAERSDPEVKKWLEDETGAPTSTLRSWWAPGTPGSPVHRRSSSAGAIGGSRPWPLRPVRRPRGGASRRGIHPRVLGPTKSEIAGSSLPSLHSYGIAIDLDSGLPTHMCPGPGGTRRGSLPIRSPRWTPSSPRGGSGCGSGAGHWRPDADLMHFQIDCHPDELSTEVAGQRAVTPDTTVVSEDRCRPSGPPSKSTCPTSATETRGRRSRPCRRFSAPGHRLKWTDRSARTQRPPSAISRPLPPSMSTAWSVPTPGKLSSR